MNLSTSECSSGCESGWTTYLDQSSNSANQCQRTGHEICRNKVGNVEEDEEDDEDLSMVSDASSGPRNFHEHEECSSASEPAKKKSKQKRKIKEHSGKQQNSYLDDTASSPVLGFSKKNLPLSNNQASMEDVTGFSATHLKGKSALQKHFGFLKPSISGKAASEKSGGLQGRKWQ